MLYLKDCFRYARTRFFLYLKDWLRYAHNILVVSDGIEPISLGGLQADVKRIWVGGGDGGLAFSRNIEFLNLVIGSTLTD